MRAALSRTLTFDRLLNLVLLGLMVYGIALIQRSTPERQSRGLPKYDLNERVPTPANVDYATADRTLVLFLASGCRYCTDSMPFYRSLVVASHEKPSALQFVTIGYESESRLRTYLQSHELGIAQVSTLQKGVWSKLTGTPTLVVVDRNGRVQGTWVGALSARDEREVRNGLGL